MSRTRTWWRNLLSRRAAKAPLRKPQRRLEVETLERREVLTCGNRFSSGVLLITCDNVGNSVEIVHDFNINRTRVFTQSRAGGPRAENSSPPTDFPNGISIVSGNGADQITIAATVRPVAINAGAGDDFLRIGGFVPSQNSTAHFILAPVTVMGGDGRDTLTLDDTNTPFDRRYRLSGNRFSRTDFLDRTEGLAPTTFSAVESVQVVPGRGNDQVILSPSAHPGVPPAPGTPNLSVTLRGNLGNDRIDATAWAFPVVMLGGPGNDILLGGSGADRLFGEDGNDLLKGGLGNDELDGSVGSDQIDEDGAAFVLTNSSLTGSKGTDTVRQVERVLLGCTFAGGCTFDAAGFTGQSTLVGAAGDDLLKGGPGDDVLTGAAGNDLLIGGGGNDRIDAGLGSNQVLPRLVKDRRLSAAELQADGELAALLEGNGPERTLSLIGPGGAGFEVVGNWTRTQTAGPNGTFAESFAAANSTFRVITPLGALPIPLGTVPLVVTTRADRFDNVGFVTSISGFTLGLTSDDPNTPLNAIKQKFGLSFATPGLGLGVKLGKEIKALPGFQDAPLANGVPYFFFGGSTATQITFGTLAVSVGDIATVAFAMDPGDISVYLKRSLLGNTFTVGASLKGHIPFTPTNRPTGVNDQITGHLYAKGTLDLSLFTGLPLSVTGEMVYDLGTTVRDTLNGDMARRLATGERTFLQELTAQMRTLRWGINADITLGFGFGTGGIGISLPLNTGTMMWTGDRFAFRADLGPQIVPDDSPFAILNPAGRTVVDGFVRNLNDFSFRADYTNKVLGGLVSTTTVTAEFTPGRIVLAAGLRLPLGIVEARVRGELFFNGDITLEGGTGFGLQASIPGASFQLAASVNARFTRRGSTFSLTAGLGVQLTATVLAFQVSGNASADLAFSGSPTSLQMSARGRANGSVRLGAAVGAVGAEFTLNNTGFTLITPAFMPNITVRFNTPPAFEDRSITAGAIEGDVVTLGGTITEPDAPDTFRLEVNWGDGTPTETYDFPAGADRRRVEIPHVYRDGGAYDVTMTWTDPNGEGNTATLPVTITHRPRSLTTVIPNTPLENGEAALDGLFTSLGDAATVSIHWGDGTASTHAYGGDAATFREGHRYAAAGDYSVTLTVTDDDGQTAETQTTVSVRYASPEKRFVDQLYRDLLGRRAETAGLDGWAAFLTQGGSRTQVTAAVLGSREYHRKVVQEVYVTYLGRDADPAGLEAFTDFLGTGGTADQVKARVAASPEYAVRQGDTDDGFLEGLYQAALGRSLDDGGRSGWAAVLQNGTTRGQVAERIFGSAEAGAVLVQGYYQQFLRREAESAGVAGFVARLQNGTRLEDVIAGVLGSEEYFGRL